MNFVEQLLSFGFERLVSDIEKRKGRYDGAFKPNNGWMGVVTYHPVEIFTRDNIEVLLSLEKFNVKKFPSGETINEKEICIKIGDKIIYHNFHGVIPQKEIIDNILSA